jgi:zinc/manganese transport system substrate-binding protein
LETWASEFTKSHSDLTYAATEPVVYYLMADLGFKDQTPKGYTQSTASGGEPAPADLQSFQKLIEDKGVDVLVNNTQEASDATNMITGAAGRADVPVVDVSEQMPKDADTLNAWINQLINTIIDAVDPSYGCEDATDGDTAGSNANSDDSSAEGSATDDANAQDSKASTGSSTDPKYIRQCKAAASSDSSQDSAKADAANGDSGDASGNDQTDSGK